MAMFRRLSIDLETKSKLDIYKTGVYAYSRDPDFRIMLFGYSVDMSPPKVIDLENGEEIPDEILDALTDDEVEKWAFNCNFERVCLSRYLHDIGRFKNGDYGAGGDPCGYYLDPKSWRCSMVWAAYNGLPMALKDVGAVLGFDRQKMEEGKDLIRFFCGPCKPTKANGGRTWNLPEHAPDKWELFKKYNLRDVEVEMQIQQRLAKFPVPDSMWQQYILDQKINDQGVAVDALLAREAVIIDERAKEDAVSRMQEITHLENPNSVLQMRGWLSENGVQTESLDKKTVSDLIKTVPPEIAEVLTLRQQASKTSTKKYQTMLDALCPDGRVRGCFQFTGAVRTHRWSGRLIQLQNLVRNTLPDLADIRELVKAGDYDTLSFMYPSVPQVLSELIRAAFVPADGYKFVVSDYAAIEARVIAWYAGETWRMKAFAEGKDIYCESASMMFHKPVVKHGVNGELRAKGKVAELACIAEGQLVLTDSGLVPIQDVTKDMKLWDGEEWVGHGGIVYKGERDVIAYDGLTATPDHFVWVEGEDRPIHFGLAAACGAHLVQTGDGGTAVRLGEDSIAGETMESEDEPLLCNDAVSGVRENNVADSGYPDIGEIKGMPVVLSAKTDTEMAGQKTYGGKTEMYESGRPGISELRRAGDTVPILFSDGSRTVSDPGIWPAGALYGNRQDRYERRLCPGECEIRHKRGESAEQEEYGAESFRAEVLAVCEDCGDQETFEWPDSGRCDRECQDSGMRKAEELASYRGKARVYDILDAGRHHRFTVSGHLVHNCGYGGGIGAMRAMDTNGDIPEDELQGIVNQWRQASPNIVQFWWDVGDAAMDAIRYRTEVKLRNLTFTYKSGALFITLPSGLKLIYPKPQLVENRFGGVSIEFWGIGTNKKWCKQETYGPKLVENIVQSTARDLLAYAMMNLSDRRICMHIHDEVVVEVPEDTEVTDITDVMGQAPPWAKGLLLRGDGYSCEFYQKD